MRNVVIAMITVWAVYAFPHPASAQDAAQRWRFGAGGGLFSFNSLTFEADNGIEVDAETFGFGWLDRGFVDVAYGISSNLLVGGRITAKYEKTSPDGGEDTTETSVGLQPYLELLLGRGAAIPFLRGGLAFNLSDQETGNIEGSFTTFGATIGGGAHLFATESFSFSPEFGVFYGVGSGELGGGNASADVDVTGFGVEGALMLNGWF